MDKTNPKESEDVVEEKTSLALGEIDGEVAEIPYRFLSRHGVIAGSTGTGKSRAMQVLAEQLADDGVHVFVSDVKGDASGFCVEGEESDRNKIAPYQPHPIKANYWSLSDRFIPFRFSLSNVGSVLFSRLISLNPTQESHLAIAFSYAKKNNLKLDTPDQLLDVLDEIMNREERGISRSSITVIQRKIISMQESGLGKMFGSPSVRLEDLGGLNVLNLSDSRSDMAVTMAPAFLLQKLFMLLPEVGDLPKPKFVVFFDEAHYLFKDANKSLKDLMVTMLKQIRSKGVGVFFVTQDVTDLPDEILSQLSTKIIFSQKVFTEKGNVRLRALAKSFPKSKIDIMEILKTMPPGVALMSTLDNSGNQTEPKQVKIFAPATTMTVVDDDQLRSNTDQELIRKYAASEQPKKPSRASPEQKSPAMAKPQEQMKPKPVSLPKEPAQSRKSVETYRSVAPKSSGKERRAEKNVGPSLLDRGLGGILTIIDFIIKALGKIFSALIKPLKAFFKYLTKKPVRIIYFLIFLLVLYIVIVNFAVIQSFLNALKLH